MKKFKFLLIVMLGFFFLASCSLDQTKYPTNPGDDEITEGEESYTLTFKYYDSLETIVSYTKKITNPVLESDISVTVPNGYALSFVDEEGQVVEVEDIRTTSTVYVKISPREYTLRFIEGGTVVNELLVAYNETIEAIEATKVPTGKKFIGWSSSEDEYVEYVFDKMPSESVVLYAFYEELTYSITLQTNVVALEGYNNVSTYKYGDRIGNFVPSDLQAAIDGLDNYVFAGWYLDEACTEKFDEIAMPAKNITLYAKWDYAGLTFFDGNTIIEVFDGELGDTIVFPEAPEKVGYTFVGWFYDEELTQEVLADAVITEDLHAIYAKYTGNERPYKVEYYLQSFGVSYVLNVDATINAKGNTGDLVEAEIKSFEGFTYNANHQSNVLEGNVLGDGSLVLKVYYTRNSYSIKFYTDGNLYHETTLKYGAEVVAPSNPSKVGYTFNGWDVTVPATMPANDVTVEAVFEINTYVFTYIVEGVETEVEYQYGASVATPADPSKVGYSFQGWSPVVPATMPANDVTVEANWEINEYKITYYTYDGVELGYEMIEYNQPIALPSNPEKDDYVFMGWVYEDGSLLELSNMPANNINVYESWGISVEQWQLVTNVNDLSVGDQIVIVAKNSNVALSTTQNGNNRGQESVTKNTSNNTVTFGSGVQKLTLKDGTVSETFGLYTGSGYLYAASSSSNYLRTQTTNNANGSWKITITSAGVATIKAQGTNTKNWLRQNSNNSIFSCYGSGQNDVSIYKYVNVAQKVELVSIKYDINGGTGTISPMENVKGSSFVIPTIDSITAPAGKLFKEWNSKIDGTGVVYEEGQTITLENNLELFAIWEEVANVILSFNSNGGTGNIESITKEKYSTFTIPSIDEITPPTGMLFVSWNTKQDGTGTSYDEGDSIELDENLELFAIWEIISNVTLSFNANGGTGTISSIENIKGSIFTVPAIDGITAPSGMKFKEWNNNSDGTGTSYVEGDTIELDKTLELFAIWESLISYVDKTYSYTVTSKQFTANGTKKLGDLNWTLSGNGGNYWGYDGTKGQQFGSGSAPYKSMELSSSELENVSKITINTSGASSINGTLNVYVGSTLVGTIKLTSSASSYTFNCDNLTGAVRFVYSQTSSKAIYIKSITVNYQTLAQ